ncbi:hypothetical protein [Azohydromonas caseinilytica]|uniref:Uncharacterized protein n=1 Tax=Azohydromonas caseinilytica TaxID=2728836 RepID=A0A848FA10_9BURK|nr:hypothetical protein [Azohydromonas caseinilytica]NML16088.1 hypothetical protein [Azohydromonas caseinilytica]
MRPPWPWRLGRSAGLLLVLPVALAWLSSRGLAWLGAPPPQASPSAAMLAWLLWWGPLLETALLLAAAAAVTWRATRHRPSAGAGRVACTLIIGLSFLVAHVPQSGPAALASMPMALLLAGRAAHAVRQPARQVGLVHAPALYAMHVAYNASVLWIGSAA